MLIGMVPWSTISLRSSAGYARFIEVNAIHELVHILTPQVKGDPLLARLIEEGRATYILWLLTGAPRAEVMPLLFHELKDYATCLPKLFDALRMYVKGYIEITEEELFTIHNADRFCGLKLAGYYLGFYIALLLHDYHNGDIGRLAKVSSTEDLEKVLRS